MSFTLVGDDCFFISDEYVGWIEAKKKCEQREASLVSLETVEKKERLVSLVRSISRRKSHDYWLGGNDIYKEGEWEWAGDRTGVPDYGWREALYNSLEENCLAWRVDTASNDYWQGMSCCNNLQYVCQIVP